MRDDTKNGPSASGAVGEQSEQVTDEDYLRIGQKHGMSLFTDVAGGKWIFPNSVLQEDFLSLCRDIAAFSRVQAPEGQNDQPSEFIDVRKRLPMRGQRIQGLSRSGAWIETFDPDEPLGHMTHWRPYDDSNDPKEPSPGPAADTMTIDYELGGRFWHIDCKKSRNGIMRPVSHEENSSTIECMHCVMRGSYPVGAIGRRTVAAAPSVNERGDGN